MSDLDTARDHVRWLKSNIERPSMYESIMFLEKYIETLEAELRVKSLICEWLIKPAKLTPDDYAWATIQIHEHELKKNARGENV